MFGGSKIYPFDTILHRLKCQNRINCVAGEESQFATSYRASFVWNEHDLVLVTQMIDSLRYMKSKKNNVVMVTRSVQVRK